MITTMSINLILELVGKYGLPLIQDGINTLNKDIITEEDIKNLEQKFKNPEEYFK